MCGDMRLCPLALCFFQLNSYGIIEHTLDIYQRLLYKGAIALYVLQTYFTSQYIEYNII